MNVRNMLLAGILFVAPYSMVIAEDTTPPAEAAKVERTWIAAAFALPLTCVNTVADWTVNPVANWTTIPVLNQLTRISYLQGGRFQENIPTIGRLMVTVAAVYAAIKAHEAYNADAGDDLDEDTIFTQEM
jgi:hypothetical protein